MNKELIALEKMCSATLEEDLSVRDIYENEYEIVEQALIKKQENEKLEEEIGCPLDARCKVDNETIICNEHNEKFKVNGIYKTYFTATYCGDSYDIETEYYFHWKDYKKTWWLKEDRSE